MDFINFKFWEKKEVFFNEKVVFRYLNISLCCKISIIFK